MLAITEICFHLLAKSGQNDREKHLGKFMKYIVSATVLLASISNSALAQDRSSDDFLKGISNSSPAAMTRPNAPVAYTTSSRDSGMSIRLNFGRNSSRLLPGSNQELAAFCSALKEKSTTSGIVSLHLIGHTDATGNADHNLWLSGQRAKTVANDLARRNCGIPRDIIVTSGMGDRELLAGHRPDSSMHRRVEWELTFVQ